MFGYAEPYACSPDRQLSYHSNATSPGCPPGLGASRHQAQSTPNGSYLDRSATQGLNTTWERLKADIDLSPNEQHSRNTSTGYSRLHSPSPDRIYAKISRVSPNDDQSCTSKEVSDPSTPCTGSAERPMSAMTHEDIHQSVLSYRQRWQRSRRDRESLRLNRSSSEPNRQTPDVNTNTNNAQELRSRSYDFADQRNRSLLSQNHSIDRYANKSVLSSTYIDGSNPGSLRRDPVTHRKIPTNQQNGTVPLRDANYNLSKSRGSLARSHSTLSRVSRKVTLYGSDYKIHNSLVSLVFCSVLSLILAFLGLQLLLRLGTRDASGLVSTDSVLQTNDSFDNVRAVAVTFSSAVLTFNLCCVLTCSLQCFLAAKLMKCPQGEERAFKYLKESTGTRLIAIGGFFLSVPLFILASMLYFIMEYPATPAIIGVVIATIGVTFTISAIVHSTFLWKFEKTKADNNFPPYSDEELAKRRENMSHSEFSTLV
ncbi:hypothetical protein CAPTEDRAFT_227312 [Capitella teleta]|uniref:Uncharacterized protein n=1 Tax=Capitella teleta TaxID=283909 RepID=R7TS05_CAPTE|nr:hypothetical protein CAPTEDRAFT_227312 [Capitella teleta]|eukprot:ELT96362.1 hypothetical protein CAPTEDRAFT_227312 [Capitella teleta]